MIDLKNKIASLIWFGCWLILLLAMVDESRSQSKVSLAASVDKAKITIGDLIIYTVTVTHDPDVKVQLPALGENLGGFEIRDYQVLEPRKEGNRVIEQIHYTISTFETGDFEIPPIAIRYALPPDTTRNELKTESIKIVVESMKPSEEGDIRDIRAPWDLPYDWKRLLRLVALIGLVLLLALVTIYVIRKRRRGETLLPHKIAPPRPPHEIAYEDLQRLAALELLAHGEWKAYYSEISEIIRRYVEGRYQIIALEMTTTDLLAQLEAIEIEEKHQTLFAQFLQLCDLVKFAKYIPEEKDNEQVMKWALQIVDETKWVEKEVFSTALDDRISESATGEDVPKREETKG